MYVNDRKIDENNSPYIIAELSANHGGDIERAKKSIEMAAKAKVSAVKIQTYTPDTMTINSDLPDFYGERWPLVRADAIRPLLRSPYPI